MKEVLRFLIQEFDRFSTDLRRLDGYANKNFSFSVKDQKYILKSYLFEEEFFQVIQAETETLNFLTKQNPDKYPSPLTFNDGQNLKVVKLEDGKTIMRVLKFLEGDFLGNLDPQTTPYQSLGSSLAKMDLDLSSHINLQIKGKRQAWDLQYFELNRPLLHKITNPSDRKIVEYFFKQFDEKVRPKQQSLRKQVIHGDANEWNIWLTNNQVTGFIDFGDSCYSPLIHEVAVALTYVIYDKDNPLEWVSDFLKGYHSVLPLYPEEIDILYYLIAARLCTSVCQSAYSRELDPENSYATVSEKKAWSTLRKWIEISPLASEIQFKNALNMKGPKLANTQNELRRRHESISSILSVSYKKPLPLIGSAFQYMYDGHGNSILDAYNNIPHVGHCHPRVVEAGQRQMAKLNTNTRYLYDLLPAYAERLLAKFPATLNRVFFVNSGSAASDLAMRMAAKHTDSSNIMVVEHGYHGNTQTSIEISDYKFSNPKGQGQKPNILKVGLPNMYNSKYSDLETAGHQYATEAIANMGLFGKKIGAFVAEPIVGCGGQVPLAPGYLKQIYPAVRGQGGICISDEVQTGFGRMGDHFWGFEGQGVIPDIVILGKPMGNGHPIGAVVTTQEIAESFEKGVEFFSSFGGNPVSCAIGLAVLDVIEDEQLQHNAKVVGDFYRAGLEKLAQKHPCIGDVRGSGLFLGAEMITPEGQLPDTELAALIKNELRNKHILISTDGPYDNVLKTKPPLCFTKENASQVIEQIDMTLSEISF